MFTVYCMFIYIYINTHKPLLNENETLMAIGSFEALIGLSVPSGIAGCDRNVGIVSVRRGFGELCLPAAGDTPAHLH